MEIKMLTEFYGIIRSTFLDKAKHIDEMPYVSGLSLRVAGFEALACSILDAFGSLESLQAVTIVLDPPTLKCILGETSSRGARDVLVEVERTVRIETDGATIAEWANAEAFLRDLLPLSKIGAGTFTIRRDNPAVEFFMENVVRHEDPTLDDYKTAVQGLAQLADDAFGIITLSPNLTNI